MFKVPEKGLEAVFSQSQGYAPSINFNFPEDQVVSLDFDQRRNLQRAFIYHQKLPLIQVLRLAMAVFLADDVLPGGYHYAGVEVMYHSRLNDKPIDLFCFAMEMYLKNNDAKLEGDVVQSTTSIAPPFSTDSSIGLNGSAYFFAYKQKALNS